MKRSKSPKGSIRAAIETAVLGYHKDLPREWFANASIFKLLRYAHPSDRILFTAKLKAAGLINELEERNFALRNTEKKTYFGYETP